MKPKRNLISAAVVLAIAAASASPAYAVLERMGPIDNSPAGGGYPAWYQDKTGVTLEFCSPSTQAELDGGWCLLLPGDAVVPEIFPTAFFDEHFYFAAGNTLIEPNSGFRATLTIAQEGAFASAVQPGDQMVFQRHRIFLTRLPFDGDYRVITPYQDVTYFGQAAGERIFETADLGIACPDFSCTLDGPNGPWLLASATAGGAEVPPMPDLLNAPAGTDPFFDAAVAAGAAPAPDAGTGKKYLADPGRVGPITGSQLPAITVYDIDNQNPANTKGVARTANHNTFRVEVRASQADGNGDLLMVLDGETNFSLMGRLMTGSIPGNVTGTRSTYKADSAGNVTDLDVFAQATPTTQARIPAQPIPPAVTPVISFYNQACGGAVTVDPNTGATKINAGPYTAPAGTPASMANVGKDFWGQSSPGGLPPSHVCVEDTTSRNAAGQVVPSYYLVPVTDHVVINTAHYVGPENGTITVNAVSSDPTAILSLAGYGPAAAGTPGVSVGVSAGTGLDLVSGAAQVLALKAPPSQVQVTSSKGGAVVRKLDTAHGVAQLVGAPSAVNDAGSIDEDCSPTSAASCAVGQSVTVDLLANDTVMLNGVVSNLRDVVSQNLATVTVAAQAPRLGSATVSADGILTYVPNPNANGTDNVAYTVTVDGQASNQAVAAITIRSVNDVPVAANQTINGVAGRTGTMNLLVGATDPDGAADVKDAVLTTWPAGLGPQPTPVNGVISFTPAATGNFSFNFLVTDAAGAQSANTALGTVTALANETISFVGGSTQYTIAKNRWIVQGTDTVRARQEISVVYTNGIARTGENCGVAGSENLPACVVGRTTVDGTGTFLFDQIVSANSSQDPRGTFWSTRPTSIRAFSSKPVLGGSTANTGIAFK